MIGQICGKKSFEGRRYKNDVDAALDARAKFNAPIDEYNAKRGRKKLKGYYPEKHHIEGNHENRINRAINDTPELDGTISTADLGYKEYGWKHNPFLVPVAIDGVYYSHYFTSGVMGRPIGGEAPASSILKKHFVSCTAGHIHTRDFGERTRADGTRILGMVAGCYFEHDEAYAGAMPCMMWWRGLVIKRHVQGGDYDPEFMGMAAIRSRYA